MTGQPIDFVFNMEDRRRGQPARPAPRRRSEADIVAETIGYLRTVGWARKVHGGAMSQVGEPDVDACVRGRTLKAEAKAAGKRPTTAQLTAMRRWAKAGALVWWFTDLQHTKDVLDHLDEPGFIPEWTKPGCSCDRHGGAS